MDTLAVLDQEAESSRPKEKKRKKERFPDKIGVKFTAAPMFKIKSKKVSITINNAAFQVCALAASRSATALSWASFFIF